MRDFRYEGFVPPAGFAEDTEEYENAVTCVLVGGLLVLTGAATYALTEASSSSEPIPPSITLHEDLRDD